MNIELTKSKPNASMSTLNADNPWPGLLPYREADADFFCGRRSECDDLLRLVQRESPLTVLYGLSGLGKSSLLQAGLFPRLRPMNILPVYIRLGYSADQPDLIQQIKHSIARAASDGKIDFPPGNEKETLWEYFHRRDADFWSPRNRLQLPLLVLDQFEEFFTFSRLYPERAAVYARFIDELADLIEGRPPAALKQRLEQHPEEAAGYSFTRHHYKVILSLREDFLADLEGLRQLIPAIGQSRLRLQRMRGSAGLQVVLQAQHLIEADVAEQLVRFVSAASPDDLALEEMEVEPALLSVVCRELATRCRQNGEPRITIDLLEGNREQILSGFYERSIADLRPEVRAFVEDQLLTVSGFRDSVALENALHSRGVTEADILQLVDRRLLRIEERAGVQRLELTHDLLTGVIVASRDRRHKQEAADQHAREIAARDRQKRLEERASSARRLRWLAVCLALATTVALGALYLANQQRQEAIRLSESIKASLELRQQVMTGDFDSDRWAAFINNDIRFKSTATYRGYKTPSGDKVYNFKLFPDGTSIPGGADSVAFITYWLKHATFNNSLLTTGPDRDFKASYDGWGCMRRVIAVVEYKDYNRQSDLAIFDMCQLLGR